MVELTPKLAQDILDGKAPMPTREEINAHPGPSYAQIHAAKQAILMFRVSMENAHAMIQHHEAMLDSLDPRRVIAVVSPGYTDPDSRYERAKQADLAAQQKASPQ